jgi:Tfp pilus assembly PilM family ATPase
MKLIREVDRLVIGYYNKDNRYSVKVIWLVGEITYYQDSKKLFGNRESGPFCIAADGTRYFHTYGPNGTYEGVVIRRPEE